MQNFLRKFFLQLEQNIFGRNIAIKTCKCRQQDFIYFFFKATIQVLKVVLEEKKYVEFSNFRF